MGDIRLSGPLNHNVVRSLIGDDYTVTTTSGAIACKGPRGTPAVIFSPSRLAKKSLNLIVCTRSHVKARLDQIRYPDWLDMEDDLPRFQSIPRSTIDRLKARPGCRALELDITAAWWTAALHIGALSPEFYRAVIRKARKEDRLKAIGSLATVRTRQVFHAGQPAGQPEHGYAVPELVPVFRAIVYEADFAIQALADAAGPGFLMYWADALFIEPDRRNARALERFAKDLGYELHSNRKVYKLSAGLNPHVPTSKQECVFVAHKSESDRLFCPAPESDGYINGFREE